MPAPTHTQLAPDADPTSGSTASASGGPVISRFAPSPTGELHIGGARTALYAWALARASGHPDSKFLLRFEDTDLARSSDASAQRILDDLMWLGIKPDNYDETVGVDSIPKQSKQHAAGRYNQVIDQLIDAGHAYRDGDNDDDPIRFKFGYAIDYADAVYGDITSPAEANEDFIIRKGKAGEFMPTFHLAVVVDDHDMGITHVLRGQEHLTNTAKHAALLDALGWERPVWAHTPSIMNPGGSKMSKRDKAKYARELVSKNQDRQDLVEVAKAIAGDLLITDFLNKENDFPTAVAAICKAFGQGAPEIEVADFRSSGYLPKALINYISLLGWNPGNDLEDFDQDYIAQTFSLDRINKGNSTFDRLKLYNFNKAALSELPPGEFEQKLKRHLEKHGEPLLSQYSDSFSSVARMCQGRIHVLSEAVDTCRFLIARPLKYDAKAVKKNLTKNDGEGLNHLAKLKEKLASVSPWDAPTIRETLEATWQELNCKNMGGVAQPLRVALTGTAVSPEIESTLALLGKDETLERIDACLQHHTEQPA